MEITYKTMAQSSFSPHHPNGFIPDVIIDAMVEEMPENIKDTITAAFILPLLADSVKSADLRVIMAMCSFQRLMGENQGSSDWSGMIGSYEMPSHYSTQFGIIRDLQDKANNLMTETEFGEAMGNGIN